MTGDALVAHLRTEVRRLEACLRGARADAREVAAQRDRARDEIERLTAERNRLRAAGAGLANAAFSLAQSEALDERTRRSLDEGRRAWDAAAGGAA